MNACKHHAATNKAAAGRSEAPITADEEKKLRTPPPLATTRSYHIASIIALTFDAYKQSRDLALLEKIRMVIENAGLDHEWFYLAPTQGLSAFRDFEDCLTTDDAILLVKDLKTTYPGMPVLEPSMTMAVHGVLRGAKEGSDEEWGRKLPYGAIPMFLDTCRRFIPDFLDVYRPVLASPEAADKAAVLLAVKSALNSIASASQLYRPDPPRVFEEDLEGPDVLLEVLHTQANFNWEVVRIMEGLEKTVQNIVTAVGEQHRAILKHASLQDMMTKASETVDVDSARVVHNQIRGLEAYLTSLDMVNGVVDTCRHGRQLGIRAQTMIEAYLEQLNKSKQ